MDQVKNRSRKELLLGIVVIAGAVMVTSVIVEVTLRLLGYGGAPESIIRNMKLVDDPVLDWRYVPYSRFQYGKVINLYNGMGFRGEEHQFEKPNGVVRIVVIGDSVTEGYGVEWNDVFASTLQASLKDGYEVISLGMGGLNTPQEIHILEEIGIRFAPDYVVVNFVLNDCDFFSSMKAGQKNGEQMEGTIALLGIKVSPQLKRWLKSSALLYLVNERVSDLWGRLAGEERHDYFGELWASQANRAKISTAFARLQTLSREHGFKAVVLIWPLLVDYSRYQFSAVHEWVAEQSASNNFEGIDLLPVFATQPFRSLQVMSEDYVHPNAKGHKLAATEFVKWLTHDPVSSVPVANQR